MDERVNGAGDRGKLASSISNAVVGIHRQYFGRGASRTRTVMGADYVICFLEDIYTPVERTLIEAGRFPAVQATRTAFQDTMRERFSAEVERLVGRKVIGFLSQVHVDPDLAVETFILEPIADGD
jgi:uncharacterized protein YbcI